MESNTSAHMGYIEVRGPTKRNTKAHNYDHTQARKEEQRTIYIANWFHEKDDEDGKAHEHMQTHEKEYMSVYGHT